MNNLKPQLKDILLRHTGRSRAITGKDLAKMLGHKDDRKIRLIIRELIGEGTPIASSTEPPAGYFLVSTWQEVEQYAQSIKSRLISDALRRRDFRRSAALLLRSAEQGRLI
tara:strand:+ start:222 stop:554 length:333 start_codon:yes stop_codon:yes gene_type:complete